jgi:hypothetical protein
MSVAELESSKTIFPLFFWKTGNLVEKLPLLSDHVPAITTSKAQRLTHTSTHVNERTQILWASLLEIKTTTCKTKSSNTISIHIRFINKSFVQKLQDASSTLIQLILKNRLYKYHKKTAFKKVLCSRPYQENVPIIWAGFRESIINYLCRSLKCSALSMAPTVPHSLLQIGAAFPNRYPCSLSHNEYSWIKIYYIKHCST